MTWEWSSVVAVYSAVLATALAVIRFKEYRNSRPNIELDCIWRDLAEAGNDVTIKNNSTMPVTITGLDVIAAQRAYDEESITYLVDPGDDVTNIRIEPRGAYTITFAEGEHFPMASKHGTIYVRLSMVGLKKRLWLPLRD